MSDLKTRLKNGPVAMPGYDYYGHPERVYAEDEADILFLEAVDHIEELEQRLGQFTNPIAKELIDAALSGIIEDMLGRRRQRVPRGTVRLHDAVEPNRPRLYHGETEMKRYSFAAFPRHHLLEENPTGEWVRWEDVEAELHEWRLERDARREYTADLIRAHREQLGRLRQELEDLKDEISVQGERAE